MQDVVPCADQTSCAPAGVARRDRVFELATLLRRCMDDRDLAAGLIEKFTSRLTTAVQEIERALAASNWALAASKAHTLKGESGSLSALELHAAAAALEDCLRSGGFDDAPARLGKLKTTADACVAARPLILNRLGQSNPALEARRE